MSVTAYLSDGRRVHVPKSTVEDWRYEVENGDTYLGLGEWFTKDEENEELIEGQALRDSYGIMDTDNNNTAPVEGAESPATRPLRMMREGAVQFGKGVKLCVTDVIIPRVNRAIDDRREQAQQARRAGEKAATVRTWAPAAIPALAFLGIIAAFLPMGHVSVSGWGSSYGQTLSYFQAEAGGYGGFLLILFLAVFVFGILALIHRRKGIRITAAVVAMIAGAVILLLSLITMIGFAQAGTSQQGFVGSATVGLGLVRVTLVSAGLITAAIVTVSKGNSAKNSEVAAPTDS